MLYGFCLEFTPLSSGEKNFENRLGFDKVIAISWGSSTFLGHSIVQLQLQGNE